MRKWWNTKRFDTVELCLAIVLVGFASWIMSDSPPSPRNAEALALEEAYGPAKYSENEEEWIVRDFFKAKRGGVFVDAGASHYQVNSNTYFLEKERGWTGIAIEPFRHFEGDYLRHRPGTRFLPFFLSDVSGSEARMYTLGENFLGNSTDRSFVERFGKDPEEFVAPTITLNDLLNQAGITRFDFLSMDIELSEPKALAGFDVGRFRPELVCIEAHPEVRQAILDYFAKNRYVTVGAYLRADQKNLYFTPLD